MLGELVKTIADGIYNSGNHEVTFNAGDLTSGVYLYRMESNEHINSKKMLILK